MEIGPGLRTDILIDQLLFCYVVCIEYIYLYKEE